MKKNRQRLLHQLIVATCIMLFVSSCSKDHDGKETRTYTVYSPVYKSKDEVFASLNGVATTAIEQAGKLYVKDNYIYLNEVNKGIHVIDNSNPSRPTQVAFIAIPGNLDIAIKDNMLFADMYNDLLVIDINDRRRVKLTNKISNFFTGRAYVNGFVANNDDQVVIEWNEKDTTVVVDHDVYPECFDCFFDLASNTIIKKSSTGVAGSMAGMVLMNDHLYAITEMHSLGIIDISNAAAPTLDSTFFAGFDLQTIYPFEDKLFLGSAIGMFMYDVSNPKVPVSIGQFEHGRACDPVISDGDYAYVTLHAGETCGGDQNELNVIDIKDITNSKLVKTYELIKPTGLCKDGDLLFVCDGTEVKIYNAANPSALKLLQQIKSNEPYDIIAANKKAMVVAADGLYQYDYTDINHLRLLSFLATKK